MFDTDEVQIEDGRVLRQFASDVLAGESDVTTTSELFNIFLVLAGDRRGASVAVPSKRDTGVGDLAQTYEESDLCHVLEHYGIPHLVRLERRPMYANDLPEPHSVSDVRGLVFIATKRKRLDPVEFNDEGYHTTHGRFYGFPETDIQAFPSETPNGRSVETIRQTKYDLDQASCLTLVSYMPKDEVENVERAIERGIQYRDRIQELADRHSICGLVSELEYELDKYKLYLENQAAEE